MTEILECIYNAEDEHFEGKHPH